MSIGVQRGGALTTVQDDGRTGWRHLGVTRGGAMDSLALHVANILVGNDAGAAALECTFAGPELLFEDEHVIAVTGPAPEAWCGGHRLPAWRPVLVHAGACVRVDAGAGVRTTVAVAGGIDVPVVLGGRGTDLNAGIGGVEGRVLRPGDVLPIAEPSTIARSIARSMARHHDGLGSRPRAAAQWCAPGWCASRSVRPPAGYGADASDAGGGTLLRLLPGPEWEAFEAAARAMLFDDAYRVDPASNRMGIRLAGPGLRLASSREMVSSPVTHGTIQVPPDGNPIILGADAQTVGGYPRIAHVISADLPLLAQAPPGGVLRFGLVTLEEAHSLARARTADLRALTAGVRAVAQ